MAFRDTLPGSTRTPMFYNVSFAVGPGAPNRRDDVELVQFFIKRIMQGDRRIPRPSKALKIDGIFGPITESYIVAIQQDIQRHGKSVRVDGRIDRATGLESTISHTIYTIIHLNSKFKFLEPTTDFDNLQDDPEIPDDLVISIFPKVEPLPEILTL